MKYVDGFTDSNWNKYDLLLLGAPRTATYSMWFVLSKHPKISRSINKEPFNYKSTRYKIIEDSKNYIDFFHIKDYSSILVDGTPSPYWAFPKILSNIVKEDFINKVIILYILRNPYDRVYSTLKQILITRENQHKISEEMPSLEIDELIYWIKRKMLDTIRIKSAKKFTSKIYFDRMDKINFSNIFKYLEIEDIKVNYVRTNDFNEEWNKPHWKGIRDKIERDIFYKNRYKLTEIFNNEIDKLQDMAKIDLSDWIE